MKSKFPDCNNFSAAVVFSTAVFVSTATPVSTVALLLQELCDSSRVDALVRSAARTITQIKRWFCASTRSDLSSSFYTDARSSLWGSVCTAHMFER